MLIELVRIEPERWERGIGKMRHRPAIGNRIGCGDECQRRNDHLITRAHADEEQREMQGGCTIDHRDRMLRARQGRKIALEPVNVNAGRRHPAGVDAILYIIPFPACKFRLVQRHGSIRRAQHRLHGCKHRVWQKCVNDDCLKRVRHSLDGNGNPF